MSAVEKQVLLALSVDLKEDEEDDEENDDDE